ncbi:hypothetical protein CDIK_3154 [Cucumispora dikerogammari]|nr:hypothetical protein CDIK_3154 [Cucumispora dikerogammari]
MQTTDITLSEAKLILQKALKTAVQNRTPSEKEFIGEVYEYLVRHSKIPQENSIIELKADLERLGLTGEEIAQVGSLLPQSVEELKVLIPNMNRMKIEELNEVIMRVHLIS